MNHPDHKSCSASVTTLPTTQRLSLDIPAELHARIKLHCAESGTYIRDEVIALLEIKYQGGGGVACGVAVRESEHAASNLSSGELHLLECALSHYLGLEGIEQSEYLKPHWQANPEAGALLRKLLVMRAART